MPIERKLTPQSTDNLVKEWNVLSVYLLLAGIGWLIVSLDLTPAQQDILKETFTFLENYDLVSIQDLTGFAIILIALISGIYRAWQNLR